MLRLVAVFLALVTLPIGLAPTIADASTFDLIYADTLNVTIDPYEDGFTLAGNDIGLVVNTGTNDISGSAFFATQFTATSSNPAVRIYPFINNPGLEITPILPHQALGSVGNYNSVLLTKLLPGETLHNTAPLQVIAIGASFPVGFSGRVHFDLTMQMGAEFAQYGITMNFVQSTAPDLAFASAARVSSMPGLTPTQLTSWGRLKSLYR
jgi:hypothetical protein